MFDYESVLEGCYHEMGHVLATLHYFPDEDRIKSISFTRQQNGSFHFDTNMKEYQWSLPSQLEALIMCYIGGGVFQQMKMTYNKLKKHPIIQMRSYLRLQSYPRKYLIEHTKCPYEGMEDDLSYIKSLYGELIRYGKVIRTLNLEEEKIKAIDMFMPYLKCKKIDELCEQFANRILTSDGLYDTVIEMNEISTYLMDSKTKC